MTEANTPWEVTMGWSVSRKKGDFRGKDAVFARERDRKRSSWSASWLIMTMPSTPTLRSPSTARRSASSTARPGRTACRMSLALCHVAPHAAAEGTRLDVEGENVRCSATVSRIPFYDPDKTRTHS